MVKDHSYISFIRGINVSGHKIIKMQRLKDILTKGGFKNVQTYIQSGNLVFNTSEKSTEFISKKIEKLIENEFGFAAPVISFTKDDFKKIIDQNPFTKEEEKEHLYLMFFWDTLDLEQVKILESFEIPNEYFRIMGQVMYLLVPQGYGNAKLNNNFIEKKLKTIATTRNWKTVNKMMTFD